MKTELLAPAGSYESMKAAFAAGADAVYIGGSRFGARAFADNPDEDLLKSAIDYAHLRNRKLYLTVNTLLKESEMEELYQYLLPFYREGLDAAIVQDFGVLTFLHEQFPDLDLHASTQMTVTGSCGAEFLKNLGATRVVTARELSFPEIRDIHDHVDIEIESFVHGALCFCYSGQCLLSSIIGGRSGNRGRCAQPCRLPYQLLDEKQNTVLSKEQAPFLMSPKDMCTLELIPDCIEAGIYSFKMEGRMKKPEYTAGITAIYRKYIDLYNSCGREGYQVASSDMEILMDLYNRGGFSSGYYRQHNGRSMMSMKRPNHWGTIAAKYSVKGAKRSWIAAEDLHPGDVLELRTQDRVKEFVFSQDQKKGSRIQLPSGFSPSDQSFVLYRTRNEVLLQNLKKQYIDCDARLKINGKLILLSGKPAILELSHNHVRVHTEGAMVQDAQNRPLSMEAADKQIRKMGQSAFILEELDILIGDSVFLPLQALNELRREAVTLLEKQLLSTMKREAPAAPVPESEALSVSEKIGPFSPFMTVSVETEDQFRAAVSVPFVNRVLLNQCSFKDNGQFLSQAADWVLACHEHQKECYLILPWIFRKEAESQASSVFSNTEILSVFDGIVIKNLEELNLLQKISYRKPIQADHNLYTWNKKARLFFKNQGIESCCLPLELNCHELKQRGCTGDELVVYGHTPLMVSAQCFQKNTTGCSHIPKTLRLRDRKKKYFYVKNFCQFCYNVLYNASPTELAANYDEIADLHPGAVRIALTVEDRARSEAIIRHYGDVFADHASKNMFSDDFTRGHFKRKVE